ncbi:MAG: PKD domain-containing protein, partial [Bacteroidia bacterium]
KGCSDTISSNITVFNTPLAGFTATTECEGGATKFTNTYSSSIFTYKWMFGDGDSSTAENPSHIYAAAGTYQVIFTVTNNNGCATTVTKAVTVNAKPVASFTTQNECFGNVAGFVNTSTVNGDSIISYAWNFGDGQTSTAMEPTHNYSAAGTYTVTLRVATATCSDTVSQTITIYNKPVAAFTAADVCIGNATQFTNNSTVANDSFAAYVWTFGNGDTSTASNPTYTYAAAGTYNVTLYVLSASGCLDSVSRQVKVNALPSLTVTHTTSERNAKFTVSDSSFTSYAWTFGDGGTSTAKNPMHRYPDTGRYNVTVVVRNASGCEATFTDTVHIFSNSIKPAHIATGFNVDIYPNPFKEFTTLTYNLSKPATVRAAVYDMRGREVTVLVDNVQQMAGKYTQTIQPEQSQIKSGVYMLRVVVDGLPVTKQIIRVQ